MPAKQIASGWGSSACRLSAEMKTSPYIFAVLAVVALAIGSSDLLVHWIERPLDRFGWLAFAIWILPAGFSIWRGVAFRFPREDALLWGIVCVCAAVGLQAQLNSAFHLGLAVLLGAIVGRFPYRWMWLFGAIAWMPILDFSMPGNSVWESISRVLCCIVVATISLRMLACSNPEPSKRPPSPASGSIVMYLGLTVMVTLSLPLCYNIFAVSKTEFPELACESDDFSVSPIPLQPIERTALKESKAVRRFVQANGYRFIVTLIDASNDPHVIHHPSICAGGRGWRTTDSRKIHSSQGTAQLIEMERNSSTKQVIYWFSEGGSRHSSFLRYRLDYYLDRIRFDQQDGVFFVVVHLLGGADRSPESVLTDCHLFRQI